MLAKGSKVMSRLLIEVDRPEDEASLMKLLPKLNARLIERQKEAQTLTLVEMARKIAAYGR
ncbi:hypothetical protein GCM10027085_33840 [Spirosoma aerophilum]